MYSLKDFYRRFGDNDMQREFNFSHFLVAVILLIGACVYLYFH